MKFELTGDNVGTDAEYKYTVTGTNETKTIKSGENFKLKNDQTAEIVGLPAGSTYTITEESAYCRQRWGRTGSARECCTDI